MLGIPGAVLLLRAFTDLELKRLVGAGVGRRMGQWVDIHGEIGPRTGGPMITQAFVILTDASIAEALRSGTATAERTHQ